MANNNNNDLQDRSVFIGNIPHDSEKNELKQFFSKAGPVMNVKIIFDNNTQKSKGYGFCEYHDAETAQIAIKNLNGQIFNGRALRVDTAKETKVQSATLNTATVKTQNEPMISLNNILESITNAVATLAPEKIYEILRVVQTFIKEKPDEAQEMLQNNPQLAYALLQAQVASNLITQAEASKMIHKKSENIAPLFPDDDQDQQITQTPQNLPFFGQSPQKSNAIKIENEKINNVINIQPVYSSDDFVQQIRTPAPEMTPVPTLPPIHDPRNDHFQNNNAFISQLPPPQVSFNPQNMPPQFGQPMNIPPHGVPSGPPHGIPSGPPNMAPPMRQMNNPGFSDVQYVNNNNNNNNNNSNFRADQQINDRGFEQQFGSNFNEPMNNNFNENYARNEEPVNRRYGNRQNMNYQNQGRNHPNEDQYRPNNRDFQQQEPLNHGYPENNFRTEDQSNQRYENYYQPESQQFQTEEFGKKPYGNVQRDPPKGEDFGEDRFRQNRGREQARNMRNTTRPYDNNRRNDGAERYNDNNRQPPQRQRPVDPRTIPRRQDQMPGQYQNQH